MYKDLNEHQFQALREANARKSMPANVERGERFDPLGGAKGMMVAVGAVVTAYAVSIAVYYW